MCSKCKQVKPKTEFSHNARRVDGINGWCKACAKEQAQERRRKKREAKNAAIKSTKEQRYTAAVIVSRARAALKLARGRGLMPTGIDLIAAAMDDVRQCGAEIKIV